MKNLFIIDAYNLIYRMFYAIPEMHTRQGDQINAVFGVAKFLKSLWENRETHHLIVATDGPGKNIRNDIYPEYKGTRDRMPDNLRSQVSKVFELFEALQIPVLQKESYEADDLIGSIVRHIKDADKNGIDWKEFQAVIISSDKDLCQFVEDGKIHIYDAMKQKFMRRADVIEKFAIPPEQVVDYLAIVGDTSDNIPGIMGFGPKKAEDLLGKYGSLDGIYDHLDEIPEKMRIALVDQKDNAYLSRKLASIHCDIEVVVDIEKSSFSGKDFWSPPVIELFQSLDFRSLLPTQFHAEKRKLQDPKIREIGTVENLAELIGILSKEKVVILGVDTNLVILGTGGLQYHIDPKKLDIVPLIQHLEFIDILIVGYDVKEDWKKLQKYKKPLEQKVEGQGTLF